MQRLESDLTPTVTDPDPGGIRVKFVTFLQHLLFNAQAARFSRCRAHSCHAALLLQVYALGFILRCSWSNRDAMGMGWSWSREQRPRSEG